MTVSAYRYYGDDGRAYQVILPDEFAAALSYEAANPADVYLPPTISPRSCTYIAPGSAIYRQVVITSKTIFISPPRLITVGGINYQLVSLFGEKWMGVPAGNIQVIAGPQGAPGTPGADAVITSGEVQLTGADVTLSTSSPTTIVSTASLAAGTYIVLGSIVCQANTSASTFRGYVDSTGGTGAVAYLQSLAAAQIATLHITALMTLGSAGAINLKGQGSAGTPKALLNGGSSGPDNTTLAWIKIA